MSEGPSPCGERWPVVNGTRGIDIFVLKVKLDLLVSCAKPFQKKKKKLFYLGVEKDFLLGHRKLKL